MKFQEYLNFVSTILKWIFIIINNIFVTYIFPVVVAVLSFRNESSACRVLEICHWLKLTKLFKYAQSERHISVLLLFMWYVII